MICHSAKAVKRKTACGHHVCIPLSKSRKHVSLGAIPTMSGGERQPRREESVEKEEEKERWEEQLIVTHAYSNDDVMVTPGPAITSHPALRATCEEKAVSGGWGSGERYFTDLAQELLGRVLAGCEGRVQTGPLESGRLTMPTTACLLAV